MADPCLFISPTVLCVIYVDDALFVYRSAADVDDLTSRMEKEDILFEEEDDVAGYLGVKLKRDENNDTITLSDKFHKMGSSLGSLVVPNSPLALVLSLHLLGQIPRDPMISTLNKDVKLSLDKRCLSSHFLYFNLTLQ